MKHIRFIGAVIICISSLSLGSQLKEYDIKNRVKDIHPAKECYTNQDIEYIVFGEIQE